MKQNLEHLFERKRAHVRRPLWGPLDMSIAAFFHIGGARFFKVIFGMACCWKMVANGPRHGIRSLNKSGKKRKYDFQNQLFFYFWRHQTTSKIIRKQHIKCAGTCEMHKEPRKRDTRKGAPKYAKHSEMHRSEKISACTAYALINSKENAL